MRQVTGWDFFAYILLGFIIAVGIVVIVGVTLPLADAISNWGVAFAISGVSGAIFWAVFIIISCSVLGAKLNHPERFADKQPVINNIDLKIALLKSAKQFYDLDHNSDSKWAKKDYAKKNAFNRKILKKLKNTVFANVRGNLLGKRDNVYAIALISTKPKQGRYLVFAPYIDEGNCMVEVPKKLVDEYGNVIAFYNSEENKLRQLIKNKTLYEVMGKSSGKIQRVEGLKKVVVGETGKKQVKDKKEKKTTKVVKDSPDDLVLDI